MVAKTESKKAKDPSAVVEKVSKLVSLAQSDNEEEARTAAMQAARLMVENELVCVPRSELESAKKFVEGAQSIVAKAKQQANKQLAIGLALGFFGAKKF